jgi:hypothetical protein
MDGLSVGIANDKAITEISNLVKLTFLRVKQAPGAFKVLDLTEQAQLIKGMRIMAARRQHMVANKKPREAEAASAALEAMGIQNDDSVDGIDFAGMFGG